jgi:hypothetical protein
MSQGLPPSLNQFYLSETFGDLFWAGGRWRRSDRWVELYNLLQGLCKVFFRNMGKFRKLIQKAIPGLIS